MSEADYYPLGAYKDPNAPYNQQEIPEKDFPVVISESLSKETSISDNNYYYEDDFTICTDNINFNKAYVDQHFTPSELIDAYKSLLISMLKANDQTYMSEFCIKNRIIECENWIVDEAIVEPT